MIESFDHHHASSNADFVLNEIIDLIPQENLIEAHERLVKYFYRKKRRKGTPPNPITTGE